MLIFGPTNWPEHRRWFRFVCAASLAAAAWYGAVAWRDGRAPGGSSLPGVVTGVIGGLIVVFEMLLWPRKAHRTARIGRVKTWMKAHIWLGLLSFPLLLLHGAAHWRPGNLSGILMLTFVGVVASGVWGLALQQYLPKLMLDQLPAETIRSQIDWILGQYVEEADRVVRLTCGVEAAEASRSPDDPSAGERSFVVVGAVRSSGPLQGKYLRIGEAPRRIPGSEPLQGFYESAVRPYLTAERGKGHPLASAKRAGPIFQEARTRIDPEAHAVAGFLEELCDQRRQFDLQARLHAWLHAWLLIHLPLSTAMFILMIAHVYYALKYF